MKGLVHLSLGFIFGRAGSGKSTLCLDEIRSELQQSPIGPPLIMLVPEQATHQMEVALAKTPELRGIMRSQILSFRRLSWRVLAETGGGNQVVIGENGKRMILRRLLLQQRPNLKVLARSATRPGMADDLARVIGEFKSYRISVQDLASLKIGDQRIVNKLQDLALIYQAYEQALQGQAFDSCDELNLLAAKLPLATSLQGSKIWVDGFKGFTPQELEVLQGLLMLGSEVIVTLPIDPEIVKRTNQGQPGVFEVGEEFFADSWQTYQAILGVANKSGVIRSPDVFLGETRRFQNEWLRHLEGNFYHYPTRPLSAVSPDQPPAALRIIAALNKQVEVEGIARELRRLARDEELRWNQMALLSGNLNEYHELIERIFTLYQIPCFIDHKRPVIHHPLIELLLSSMELALSDWAYEPLFRCLKTGFFPVSNDAVDRLENYCLEYGIKGIGWRADKDWNYARHWTLGADEADSSRPELRLHAQLNLSRRNVRNALLPFMEAVAPEADGTPKSVRALTEALFMLIETLGIPEQLQLWAKQARHAGHLSEALLQEQIWNAIIELFDELVVGLGEERLELADYLLILTSGLENLEVGLIPPGMDQVLVGSLDRSRNPEVKVLFLLGANEGVLPKRQEIEGMLSNSEREFLAKEGINLAPKGKALVFEEQFFVYTGLTRARDKVYVIYPLTDDEGKGLTVSPVISRLALLFPTLGQEFWENSSDELATIAHPESLLDNFAVHLRSWKSGEEIPLFWQGVEDWLSRDPQYRTRLRFLQAGLERRNQEKPLEKGLTRKLYGKNLLASVSRLEQFARCPFAHYARYGLKLRTRAVQQLSNPDMGEFFHALLRDFALYVRENKLDWGKMTRDESWAVLSELTDHLTPQIQNEILLSTARYRYLTHRLKRTVHHAVRVLGEHAKRGQFLPIRAEVGFGPDEELPGKVVSLSDGESLILRGQIDRIDAAVVDEKIYLRVIDYKSRESSLSIDSIYHGLSLQLLSYLDVALNGAEVLLNSETSSMTGDEQGCSAAGFLYFPVLEPILEEKTPRSEGELDDIRLHAVKVHGYLLADRKVLEAMDDALTSGDASLLGIRVNKDGTFRKGSPVLTSDQVNLLRLHLNSWLQQAGDNIMAGDIALLPYRSDKDDGCQYCSYKPVCHFDSSLPENTPRILSKMTPDAVWQQLQADKSGGKNTNGSRLQLESGGQSSVAKTETSTIRWLGEEGGDRENILENGPGLPRGGSRDE